MPQLSPWAHKELGMTEATGLSTSAEPCVDLFA